MNHLGTVPLETSRLILRRFEITDADNVFNNWVHDEEVTKYLTWPVHEKIDVTRDVLSGWIESYKKLDFYNWAIVEKNINQPIGNISTVDVKEKTQSVEMGYCIGKSFWGKGYVAEALIEVVRFLFEDVKVNRIEAKHEVRNPNSGKVMKKAGLIYEGTLRAAGKNNQGICDEAVYGIIAADYFRNNPKAS